MKKRLLQLFVLFFTSLLTIGVIEIFLIIKNKYIVNYDIEMWKYTKSLKIKSTDPDIAHIHKKNKTAVLQKVDIKINNLGMRGRDIDDKEIHKFEHKILVLGSSIALGWGVEEEKTFSYLVEKKLNEQNRTSIVLNAGIGNYNTKRYVSNYFKNLSYLKPDEILVLFFVNDTEILKNNYGNYFTKNFNFAVLLWKYFATLNERINVNSIENYYLEKYKDEYEGFIDAKKNLIKLHNHCIDQNIKCTLILMPDINNFDDGNPNYYKLDFINDKMISFSKDIGLNYLDLLPFFEGMNNKNLLNKYNDPHPNEIGHQIIAEAIIKYLR